MSDIRWPTPIRSVFPLMHAPRRCPPPMPHHGTQPAEIIESDLTAQMSVTHSPSGPRRRRSPRRRSDARRPRGRAVSTRPRVTTALYLEPGRTRCPWPIGVEHPYLCAGLTWLKARDGAARLQRRHNDVDRRVVDPRKARHQPVVRRSQAVVCDVARTAQARGRDQLARARVP